ncbi:MAG: hypothetical protein HYS22_02335 [Deltaproteobacteria bacterium]|nr:hypothetical protein [Deltaproteobacteria bacterium]
MTFSVLADRLKKNLPFRVSELQAFIVGLLVAFPLFYFYMQYLSPHTIPFKLEKLRKEENGLQEMIKETDTLLQELSTSLKRNREILKRMEKRTVLKPAPTR